MGRGLFAAKHFAAAVEAKNPTKGWYCNKPNCDGKPHGTWTEPHARAAQHPPQRFSEGAARIWLIMAGRGFGKTRSGAEWIAAQARKYPNSEWAVLAPTFKDLKEICIEALMEVLADDKVQYNRSSLEIVLPTGAKIRSYSAEAPERVRGPNLSGAWLDEIAQSQLSYPQAYKQLSMAIRKRGSPVQLVATTTPDGQSKLVREFTSRQDNSVCITKGSTFDNRDNLAEAFIEEVEERHKGTRWERQEIYGELLEDVPGALWTPRMIERNQMEMPTDAPKF
jgi:phage terminase large subunit-like protein